jgi:hypothetical protein
MFELVVAKPADGFIAAPGLQEFKDVPGPDEFNVFPGRLGNVVAVWVMGKR